jgi:hypothetical protein
MIGATQWAILLGRFDINTAAMSMSHFRVAPRVGHLDRMKTIYGYLNRFKDGAIHVRTSKPDLSSFPMVNHNWIHSVYGNVTELIPDDKPIPLGDSVLLMHYENANLFQNIVTGRALTSVLHFINNTPIEWYSKRQATVETATYGAEFVAARIATNQIVDLRTTLRYLGVPIDGMSQLFRDNASVVISASIPHTSLKKRQNTLSYHREAICAGILYLREIHTKSNYGDVLTKHTGFTDSWPNLRPLLFWKGEIQDARKNI